MVRLRVKEVAAQRNIKTQRELATRSGATVQVVNRYWNSNVQQVNLAELEKIAVALAVKIGDLLVSDRDPVEEDGHAEQG